MLGKASGEKQVHGALPEGETGNHQADYSARRSDLENLVRMRSKFNAKRTELDGIVFASKKESVRYSELRILEKSGVIRNLELQPKFLIEIDGKKICTYVADFCYLDTKTKRLVYEDVKGMKTPVYRLKKKMVEARYRIEIIEV
jgi:hypothetical protein